ARIHSGPFKESGLEPATLRSRRRDSATRPSKLL
ncbi:hypothetical protein AVEN_204741-1, partial [Araneus ventricosus]